MNSLRIGPEALFELLENAEHIARSVLLRKLANEISYDHSSLRRGVFCEACDCECETLACLYIRCRGVVGAPLTRIVTRASVSVGVASGVGNRISAMEARADDFCWTTQNCNETADSTCHTSSHSGGFGLGGLPIFTEKSCFVNTTQCFPNNFNAARKRSSVPIVDAGRSRNVFVTSFLV